METLQSAKSDGETLGKHQHLVFDADAASGERSGNDGARSLRGKGSIDPQPRSTPVDSSRRNRQHVVEREAQIINAGSLDRVDRHDRRVFEEGASYAVFDIEHCEFDEFFICLLYTSPSPRDQRGSRMPSSA